MTRTRIVGLIALSLITLYGIACAVSPWRVTLAASITVFTKPSSVFANIVCLDKWPEWDKWTELDPSADVVFSSRTCGLEATSNTYSDELGTIRKDVVGILPNEVVVRESFTERFGTGFWNWSVKDVEGRSELNCVWTGPNQPFLLKPLNYFVESIFNERIVEDLQRIKTLSETDPKRALRFYEYLHEVKEVDFRGQGYILIEGTMHPMNVVEFKRQSFEALYDYASRNELSLVGKETALAYFISDSVIVSAAALPVSGKDVKGESKIEFRYFEPTKALELTYFGDRTKHENAHLAVRQYIQDMGYKMKLPIVEVYEQELPNDTTNETRLLYFVE